MARRISSPAFVGRSAQMDELTAALGRAAGGRAVAVLIGGESGVGKSRLAAEFEPAARAAGARVLRGGCADLGGTDLPYVPVIAALRALVRETSPEALLELAGPGRETLARLLPELGASGPALATSDPLAQSRLFDGLLALLGRLTTDDPLALVIEDLHWADASTRAFLTFLLRNMQVERLLVIGTYRTDELHRRHALRPFLADAERVDGVERIELERFTRRELAAQLEGILDAEPEPTLVNELFERSQGNALFAEELLAASGGDGRRGVPESLRDALTLRVEMLPDTTRELLAVAAAAGGVAGHGLLEAACRCAPEQVVSSIRDAIEHNVLVVDEATGAYAFRHALLREALYEDLLPHERSALHATLATALERDASLAVGGHGAAAERAAHWYAAHALGPALAASIEAGEEAERVWASAEANRQLERAVELWDRVAPDERPPGVSLVDLVRRAAQAAYLAGKGERAITLARHALELIDPEEAPVVAGLVHERLGRYLMTRPALDGALAEYRSAAALLPDEPSPERAALLAGQAHVLMLRADPEAARAPCEEAIAIARTAGASLVECAALSTLGATLGMLGDRESGIEALRQAKRLADQLGAHQELVRCYVNLGELLDQAGRADEAVAVAVEGWHRLRLRARDAALLLASEAANRLLRGGRVEEAAALLEQTAETVSAGGMGSLVFASQAELEIVRGNLDRAEEVLERVRLTGRDADDAWEADIAVAAARLALERHRPEQARAALAPWLGALDGSPSDYGAFLLARYAVEARAEAEIARQARVDLDEAAEAAAVARADALAAAARSLLADWSLGPPPAAALLDLETVELERGRAHGVPNADGWAAHATAWAAAARPFDAAYAHLREAEDALERGASRTRAAAVLARARATAVEFGGETLLSAIDELAARARLQIAAGPPPPDQPEGLTPRELEVLRLLAEGHTNREIGSVLYMSPKTASVHVSRILTKLDVRNRSAAARVAQQRGLVE